MLWCHCSLNCLHKKVTVPIQPLNDDIVALIVYRATLTLTQPCPLAWNITCTCTCYMQCQRTRFGKRPVTPSGVSTALAGSSLIFRNTVRSQEIPDVFLKKAPVTASSHRPRSCYGALVAFYRVPTEFFLAILCALTTLSPRFHGAHCLHCTVTAFVLRFHGVCTALMS